MRNTPTIEEHTTPRLTPASPWRIRTFSIRDAYTIEVIFNDGTQGVFDLKNLICGEKAGVFQGLQDYQLFEKADLIYGAITWPGDIDIAPDAMYQLAKNSLTGEKVLV